MPNNDTMSNAKHTPEVTVSDAKHPAITPGYYLATHRFHRPQVVEFCADASCAPHWRNKDDDRIGFDPRGAGYALTPVPSSAVLVPVETLGKVRDALDKAIVEVASTGAPFLNGRYHKDGEWSFSEMTERNNPADAAAIKKGFLLMQDALRLLAALGGES